MSVKPCYFEKYSAKIEESESHDNHPIVEIEFCEKNVEQFIESINYNLQNLISEIGGNLGLTLGLSGMSFIEKAYELLKSVRMPS